MSFQFIEGDIIKYESHVSYNSKMLFLILSFIKPKLLECLIITSTHEEDVGMLTTIGTYDKELVARTL